MIKILETKIHSVAKNKFEELKVTFLIKKEDYSTETEQELFQLSRDGELGVLVFQGVEVREQLNKSKLLQDLGFFMLKYSEKIGGDIEQEKQKLYKKYSITSRTHLTKEELLYEIESYKSGLNYDE